MRSGLFVRQSSIITNHEVFILPSRRLWTHPLQFPRIAALALLPQPHKVMGMENSAQISMNQ